MEVETPGVAVAAGFGVGVASVTGEAVAWFVPAVEEGSLGETAGLVAFGVGVNKMGDGSEVASVPNGLGDGLPAATGASVSRPDSVTSATMRTAAASTAVSATGIVLRNAVTP